MRGMNAQTTRVLHPAELDVQQPKLDGFRVALRGRVSPELHASATRAARARGLSLSDYLASLIAADTGTTGRSTESRQGALDISA